MTIKMVVMIILKILSKKCIHFSCRLLRKWEWKRVQIHRSPGYIKHDDDEFRFVLESPILIPQTPNISYVFSKLCYHVTQSTDTASLIIDLLVHCVLTSLNPKLSADMAASVSDQCQQWCNPTISVGTPPFLDPLQLSRTHNSNNAFTKLCSHINQSQTGTYLRSIPMVWSYNIKRDHLISTTQKYSYEAASLVCFGFLLEQNLDNHCGLTLINPHLFAFLAVSILHQYQYSGWHIWSDRLFKEIYSHQHCTTYKREASPHE